MNKKMHRDFLLFLLGLAIAVPVFAQGATQDAVATNPVDMWLKDPTTVFDAAEVEISDFRWIARPVVVFADNANDPAFERQMELLFDRPSTLAVRDVVVVTDTDPAQMSDLRRQLRPRGFMLALMGKDGGVTLRKPFPWDVREITRSIDKMPVRLQEIRERSNATP